MRTPCPKWSAPECSSESDKMCTKVAGLFDIHLESAIFWCQRMVVVMTASEFDDKQTKILRALEKIHLDEFEKIDLSKLLFNESGFAIKDSYFKSAKKFVKSMIYDSFVLTPKLSEDESKPLLINYDYRRQDHGAYWQRLCTIISDYDELYIREDGFNIKHIQGIKSIISNLKTFLIIKRRLKHIKSNKIRSYLASDLTELERANEVINNIPIKNRMAFIFFDGGRLENLVVQNLRNKGIVVVTLQHGQPVFHGADCDRINQTMILNFSSDYVVVTGEFSKEQFMLGGVPEEKIFIGGSLRKVKPLQDMSNNAFVVFLDCPTYPNAVRDNYEIIEIAEAISDRIKTSYLIKCHPQDDPQKYKDLTLKNGKFAPLKITIPEILEGRGFGILHASGVYLDIISEGIKAFCYVNDTFFPLVREELDLFHTTDELYDRVQQWKAYELNQKRDYLNKLTKYYLHPENADKRYLEFARTVLGLKKA